MAEEARWTLAGIAAAPEPPDGERGWLDLIADNPPSELVAALRRVKSDLAAKAVPIEPSKDEAAARKVFDLTITTSGASEFRPKAEGVLHGLQLEYELLSESDSSIAYAVSAPLDVRTRDISDTLRILASGELEVEWKERRVRK